jgi:uncharacterized protein YodC (DUF2158 family)
MARFPDGAVVRLKSGGPLMTVELSKSPTEWVREDHRRIYCCVWFEHTTLRRAEFLGGALKEASQASEQASQETAPVSHGTA